MTAYCGEDLSTGSCDFYTSKPIERIQTSWVIGSIWERVAVSTKITEMTPFRTYIAQRPQLWQAVYLYTQLFLGYIRRQTMQVL